MASIKQLDERRYKITVSNGYRPNGKKISKAKTIQVPPSVPKRGIGQLSPTLPKSWSAASRPATPRTAR